MTFVSSYQARDPPNIVAGRAEVVVVVASCLFTPLFLTVSKNGCSSREAVAY